MGKKRKAGRNTAAQSEPVQTRFDIEEQFNDSEDEFYNGRDKILLDEGPVTKRRRRIEEQEKDIQPSDEEVLGYAGSDDGDSEDGRSLNDAEVDEEDGEHWGTTKADYYNADTIETEADALDEEKEARRLQQKQLKSMTNEDFGFDEATWAQDASAKATSGPVIEKLPEARIPAGAKRAEMVGILYNRYPEFNLLARDLVELQTVWSRLQRQVATTSSDTKKGITLHTKLNALTSYLGAVAMYFAVITSPNSSKADALEITALAPTELRDHALIGNLMASRQLWDAVKDAEIVQDVDPIATVKVSDTSKETKLPSDSSKARKKKQKNITKESSPEFDSFDDIEMPELPKKTKSKPKLLDLQTLLAQSAAPGEDDQSDFGDEDPLTEQQAAEKARKKKSLRFYTSQIVQKANKRGAASREAGGDDDVPRKERLRDKQERLLKEAEKRGHQKATGDEELGGDSGDEAINVNGNGYYESLVANSKQKKADKQAKAEAYAEAAKQGAQVYEEEQVGNDGKRRITYAIEKNKGLAPKRKKDVRNPRVKKRKKYDEKMKKLSSVRQVYKAEGRGGYAGELTGIKTNLVKSIKL